MKHLMLVLFVVVCCCSTAYSTTYQVGPTRTLKKLQDVAPLLSPGILSRSTEMLLIPEILFLPDRGQP